MKTILEGAYYTDTIRFPFTKMNRVTLADVIYMGVTKASQNFKTNFEGFIGIQPYSADPEHKDKSFLYNLK